MVPTRRVDLPLLLLNNIRSSGSNIFVLLHFENCAQSSSIMETKAYYIVEFVAEKTKKSVVELVPESWILSLENGKALCYYPDKIDYPKISQWVRKKADPKENWASYPIKIIAHANNYEQGQRRLKRAFTDKNVCSSDETPFSIQNNHDNITNMETFSLTNDKSVASISNVSFAANVESGSSQPVAGCQSGQTAGHDFVQELKDFIRTEVTRAKRSICYDIEHKINEVKKLIITNSNDGAATESWAAFDTTMPIHTLETFLKFEEELTSNDVKKRALENIFKMWTAGHENYEKDVQLIIKNIIKKEVQMRYSGAGRKTKGEGKLNFQATQTYKIMEEVILHKNKNSNRKINILSATSAYLAGAKDREGGRVKRRKTNGDRITERGAESENEII